MRYHSTKKHPKRGAFSHGKRIEPCAESLTLSGAADEAGGSSKREPQEEQQHADQDRAEHGRRRDADGEKHERQKQRAEYTEQHRAEAAANATGAKSRSVNDDRCRDEYGKGTKPDTERYG